jgi:hypothetical protein
VTAILRAQGAARIIALGKVTNDRIEQSDANMSALNLWFLIVRESNIQVVLSHCVNNSLLHPDIDNFVLNDTRWDVHFNRRAFFLADDRFAHRAFVRYFIV